MHAPYDKRRASYRTEPKGSAGFLVLIAAVPLVLVAFATLQPNASVLISQAVEAEFVSDGIVTGSPTRIALPDAAVPVRTVRAN